jgi:hypothetical protein
MPIEQIENVGACSKYLPSREDYRNVLGLHPPHPPHPITGTHLSQGSGAARRRPQVQV